MLVATIFIAACARLACGNGKTPHDTGYKLLFSHPDMVRDLLTGYMPGEWLKVADFTSLNRVNASCVSESGEA